jgi:ketosteroid isomerase-like protein
LEEPMKILGTAMSLALLAVAFPVMAAEHPAQLVDHGWVKAMKANDLEAIMALYAPDAVAYFPDGDFKGKPAIRKSWTDFLAMFTVKDATSEGTYETTGNTSLGWGYWSMTVVPKAGGEPMVLKGRATVVVKKIGGKWLYTVDHASVPLPPPPSK